MRAALLLVLIATSAVATAGESGAPGSLEYRVKAAFLYNFARFVEWPPAESGSQISAELVIGVLGEDPFSTILDDTVFGKKVGGRSFRVKRFASVEQVTDCHVLFVSSSETNNLQRVLELLRGRSVLTVGDTDDFIQLGGMVRLFKKTGRVRFEINLEESERAGLQVSSRLLKVADRIITAQADDSGS